MSKRIKTTVVNIHKQPCDIYIGRAGHGHDGYFGNPFEIGLDGDRKTVIEKFRIYFIGRMRSDLEFKKRVKALKGKCLGCFCKPYECHGDIYRDYVRGKMHNEII